MKYPGTLLEEMPKNSYLGYLPRKKNLASTPYWLPKSGLELLDY